MPAKPLPISASALFSQLPGSYTLYRNLISSNPTEPSGTCTGTASFAPLNVSGSKTSVPPNELLYTETGTFQISPSLPPMQFNKSYIWLLADKEQEDEEKQQSNDKGDDDKMLSTWFVKPGTEDAQRDYLFHDFVFDLPSSSATSAISPAVEADEEIIMHAKGSHLCVKDMYDTEYWFHVVPAADNEDSTGFTLRKWRMKHVVKGPKKDQRLETLFTKVV